MKHKRNFKTKQINISYKNAILKTEICDSVIFFQLSEQHPYSKSRWTSHRFRPFHPFTHQAGKTSNLFLKINRKKTERKGKDQLRWNNKKSQSLSLSVHFAIETSPSEPIVFIPPMKAINYLSPLIGRFILPALKSAGLVHAKLLWNWQPQQRKKKTKKNRSWLGQVRSDKWQKDPMTLNDKDQSCFDY